MFARAGMYLTALSATTVALALVAQATAFGAVFHLFALLVLPVVLVLGLGTQTRLVDAHVEDAWLVIGMNRLRHAYLELAPELAPYFVTGHHDDLAGVLRTYGPDTRVTPARVLTGTPTLVGIVNALVTGVLAALVAQARGGSPTTCVAAGVAGGAAYAFAFGVVARRQIARIRREWPPRFPGPAAAARNERSAGTGAASASPAPRARPRRAARSSTAAATPSSAAGTTPPIGQLPRPLHRRLRLPRRHGLRPHQRLPRHAGR